MSAERRGKGGRVARREQEKADLGVLPFKKYLIVRRLFDNMMFKRDESILLIHYGDV